MHVHVNYDYDIKKNKDQYICKALKFSELDSDHGYETRKVENEMPKHNAETAMLTSSVEKINKMSIFY